MRFAVQRYGFFVKPPNVSATFFKKSLFLLHFMVFCRGKLAENALRNSHRCHRFSQMLLLGKNLPQNTRISQNLLLRIFSHRFHSAQMLTSGGALVSARLCRLPEQEVHQQSKYAPTKQVCTNKASMHQHSRTRRMDWSRTSGGSRSCKCTHNKRIYQKILFIVCHFERIS